MFLLPENCCKLPLRATIPIRTCSVSISVSVMNLTLWFGRRRDFLNLTRIVWGKKLCELWCLRKRMLIWQTNAECHIIALKKLAIKHNLLTTCAYLQTVVNYWPDCRPEWPLFSAEFVCLSVCLCASDRHFYPSTLTDFDETWSQGPYSDLVWPRP